MRHALLKISFSSTRYLRILTNTKANYYKLVKKTTVHARCYNKTWLEPIRGHKTRGHTWTQSEPYGP